MNNLLADLLSIVPEHCIFRNDQILEKFQHDASPLVGERPFLALFPETHSQIIHIVKTAITHKAPIIARGAGTNTTGAVLATQPNTLILSFEKMASILEIDLENATATVQPGVITETLQKTVQEKGLFYPPDPASHAHCTLGGNVAENAGGPQALKYGVTRDFIIGLKGVWGTGSPFNLGGKIRKNVVGYDLISLLVGSEGTLGIITEITVKLRPYPKYSKSLGVEFPSISQAIEAFQNITQAGISPATAELMESTGLLAVSQYLNQPTPKAEAYILFKSMASTHTACNDEITSIQKICNTHNGISQPLSTRTSEDQLWKIRKNVSLALKDMSKTKQSHDVVVPISELDSLFKFLHTLSTSCIQVLGYGHLGDGNIHVNFLNKTASQEEWETHLPRLTKSLFKKVTQLGGVISGEHGIGLTKKEFLSLNIDTETLKLMQSLKSTFDPHKILNPGKIFPH